MAHLLKNTVLYDNDSAIKINYLNDDFPIPETKEENTYFGLPVRKKEYPSCYQYNVLIMLAKRLINEEQEQEKLFENRLKLDTKLLEQING